MRSWSGRSKRIILLLTVILLMSGSYAAWGLYTMRAVSNAGDEGVGEALVVDEGSFHGFLLEPPHKAPELNLIDQHRNPFRLADHEGNLVVVFFGYTNCPDVCPATLVYYTHVKRELGPLADRVKFVFVSVDPEYDTPEHLAQYVNRFDSTFYGLSGTDEQTAKVVADYGVYVEKVEDENSPVGYWVNHSALSYVIDTDGNLRLALPFGVEPADIAADLRQLL